MVTWLLHACTIALQISYCRLSAFTGGSSHPSGPNFGVTIMSPALFLNGFENVHKDFPRVGSQAGFIKVKPIQESQRKRLFSQGLNLTFEPDLTRSHDFVIHDVVGRW